MQNLKATLQDYELDLLKIIANRWDIDLTTREARAAAEQLAPAMLNPETAAHEWSRLNDRERGALQLVVGSRDHKMPLAQYTRLYGEIRQMGSERRAREKPHLEPKGLAEVLFYRGLLAVSYDQDKTGAQAFVYVPPDLAKALPTHLTGFDPNQAEAEELPPTASEDHPPNQIRQADTSLVDDLTTLLAYLQIEAVTLNQGTLRAHDRQVVEDYFLGEAQPIRVALMVALAAALGLAGEQEGHFKPIPAQARKWLEQTRTKQVKTLVQAWESSILFNELLHLPEVVIESAGWQNNPTLIRQTIKAFLQSTPADHWFALDEFVAMVKEEEPDFQRPAGDYDSWYIRDARTDTYLKGFESWDQVDGQVLKVTLVQPMHWLGLVDLGSGEAGTLLRLTAYGRAFAEINDYPERADPESVITVEADGSIQAPRTFSRYSRFQLARFTEWGAPSDHFEYRLTPLGFTQAEQQNIKAEHIQTFLKRAANEKVPPSVFTLVEQWQRSGGAGVSIKRVVILQTETEETLQTILNTPELRRYLGSQLGAKAVIVRPGQWDELMAALQKRGVLVDKDL